MTLAAFLLSTEERPRSAFPSKGAIKASVGESTVSQEENYQLQEEGVMRFTGQSVFSIQVSGAKKFNTMQYNTISYNASKETEVQFVTCRNESCLE